MVNQPDQIQPEQTAQANIETTPPAAVQEAQPAQPQDPQPVQAQPAQPQDPQFQYQQQQQYQQPQQQQYQQQQYQQQYQAPPDQTTVYFEQADVEENKDLAYLAYLCAPLALIQNIKIKSDFVSYHCNNGIITFLFLIASIVLSGIPYAGWVINLILGAAFIGFSIMGMLNVKKGVGKPFPVVKAKFIR